MSGCSLVCSGLMGCPEVGLYLRTFPYEAPPFSDHFILFSTIASSQLQQTDAWVFTCLTMVLNSFIELRSKGYGNSPLITDWKTFLGHLRFSFWNPELSWVPRISLQPEVPSGSWDLSPNKSSVSLGPWGGASSACPKRALQSRRRRCGLRMDRDIVRKPSKSTRTNLIIMSTVCQIIWCAGTMPRSLLLLNQLV